jgi:hypothetical protein
MDYRPTTLSEWAAYAEKTRKAHFDGRPHDNERCKWCKFNRATENNTYTEAGEEVATRQELLDQLNGLVALAGRIERQLNRLAKWPDEDPLQDGDVFFFEKAWPSNPDGKYTYAGVKVRNWIFMTGRRHKGQPMTWEALIEFMGDGVKEFYVIRDGAAVDILNSNNTVNSAAGSTKMIDYVDAGPLPKAAKPR